MGHTSPHGVPFANIVQGTPIDDKDLPYVRDRMVYDRGATMVQGEYKRSEDTLDYFIDLRRFLDPDEVVTSARAGSDTDTMVVDRVEFAPTGVVVWVSGGANMVRNTVVTWVTTSEGKVKIFRYVLKTVGTAVARVEIITTPISVTVGFSTSADEPLNPPQDDITELTFVDDDGVYLTDDDATFLQDDALI